MSKRDDLKALSLRAEAIFERVRRARRLDTPFSPLFEETLALSGELFVTVEADLTAALDRIDALEARLALANRPSSDVTTHLAILEQAAAVTKQAADVCGEAHAVWKGKEELAACNRVLAAEVDRLTSVLSGIAQTALSARDARAETST